VGTVVWTPFVAENYVITMQKSPDQSKHPSSRYWHFSAKIDKFSKNAKFYAKNDNF
jgi:hypothetical protein